MKNEFIPATGEEGIALCDDTDFALYRRPDETHYTLVADAGGAASLPDDAPLEGERGFLVAPFLYGTAAPSGLPTLLIRPHTCTQAPVPDGGGFSLSATPGDAEDERMAYHRSFGRAYRRFSTSSCHKFVLSRCHDVRLHDALDGHGLTSLFFKACRFYPHSYVALWRTQAGGTWLTATPETLHIRQGAYEARFTKRR